MSSSNSSKDLGNTKPGPKRQISPAKGWCFTWNNPILKGEDILTQKFHSVGASYIFQLEKGEKEGVPHFQGYVKFISKIRPDSLDLPKQIHWEKRRGTEQQAVDYCRKLDTSTGQKWTNMKFPKPVKDPLCGKSLFAWQSDVLSVISGEPDDRKIYWYWEATGGTGKTSLAKHICLSRNALVLSGKAADVKCGVSQHLEKHKEIDVVIFDFVRSNEDFISYEAIEAVKNGIFFSGKYESSMQVFNSPHVICMANFPPEESKLSSDRWIIQHIQSEASYAMPL